MTIFSHLGGYSQGYEDRAMPTIAGNMRKFLADDLKNMINIVRKPRPGETEPWLCPNA